MRARWDGYKAMNRWEKIILFNFHISRQANLTFPTSSRNDLPFHHRRVPVAISIEGRPQRLKYGEFKGEESRRGEFFRRSPSPVTSIRGTATPPRSRDGSCHLAASPLHEVVAIFAFSRRALPRPEEWLITDARLSMTSFGRPVPIGWKLPIGGFHRSHYLPARARPRPIHSCGSVS
jgi:hypothetical protein